MIENKEQYKQALNTLCQLNEAIYSMRKRANPGNLELLQVITLSFNADLQKTNAEIAGFIDFNSKHTDQYQD